MQVGLAVMRLQPLHKGHTTIINKMNEDCEISIIGLGSAQAKDRWNPFSVQIRQQMIKNVYGDRVKIVPLNDINTNQGTNDWVNYVIDKVIKIGLPKPTSYYSGSDADSVWYKNYFGKNLHILPREFNVWPSASEIRTFLETRTDTWQFYIPAVNWSLVKDNYPEEYKIYNNKGEK